MKIVIINCKLTEETINYNFHLGMRTDPDKFIFIGNNERVVRIAADSGHEIEILTDDFSLPNGKLIVKDQIPYVSAKLDEIENNFIEYFYPHLGFYNFYSSENGDTPIRVNIQEYNKAFQMKNEEHEKAEARAKMKFSD